MKKKILIIDDEPGVLKLLKLILSDNTISIASNGDEAIIKLKNEEFDLIISDIKMPGELSGLDVLEICNKDYSFIPVIIITGQGDKANAISALKKGAYDYLEKPFDGDELTLAVNRALKYQSSNEKNLKLIKELHSSKDELHKLSEHLMTVQEEERKRISREIHDELGQLLLVFKMDLTWLQKKLESPVSTEVYDHLKKMDSLLRKFLARCKRLA